MGKDAGAHMGEYLDWVLEGGRMAKTSRTGRLARMESERRSSVGEALLRYFVEGVAVLLENIRVMLINAIEEKQMG